MTIIRHPNRSWLYVAAIAQGALSYRHPGLRVNTNLTGAVPAPGLLWHHNWTVPGMLSLTPSSLEIAWPELTSS